MTKMKAIVYKEYGKPEVLQQEEVEKPFPKSNEILVKVSAISVNYGDLIARNFKNVSRKDFNMPSLFYLPARFSFGYNIPKRNILGNTFAGEVESVGTAASLFKKGDLVFGYTGEKMGTYAPYVCLPETGIISTKPSNMTLEEASTVPYGTLMALNLLKKVNIQKGQRVLIIGASGGIGSAAVQLVTHLFGAEVTGVCSAHSTDFVKALGASNVIVYQKDGFTTNGETYDLIFDILGKGPVRKVMESLTPKGIYLLASFKTGKLLQMLKTSFSGKRKVICALANPNQSDLFFVKELIEKGKFKAVIDTFFPLDRTAEAHHYMEVGSKKGSVVLLV